MRRVEHSMGMPVSVDVPGLEDSETFEMVFSLLRDIDAQFSPYLSSSEVSRYAAGLIAEEDLSPQLRHVLRRCDEFKEKTDGYFSAYYDGYCDPSGYVKGWAIDRCSCLLQEHGADTFLINIAGDMVARGDERIWNLGIQDPTDVQKLLGTVRIRNQAVATSGTYARGNHITNPHTGSADSDLVSVSVYGDDIITADVLATAYLAMGHDHAVAFARREPHYAVLLIKESGERTFVNNFTLWPIN